MIVNYDKENGLTTFLKNFEKKIPDVSGKAKDFFSKLSEQPDTDSWKTSNFITMAEQMDIADKSLLSFLSTTEASKVSLSNYQSYLQSTAKQTTSFANITQKAGSALKTIGGTLLSTLGNIAITYAITKGIELIGTAIYNVINASEIAIQKGEEARQKISDINDAYNEKKTFNDTNAERFGELREHVDPSTNKNISLTNDEYSEYLSLCNEIAGIYPQLVTSYDAQGNAILNLGSNAETATSQLNGLLEQQKEISDYQKRQLVNDDVKGTLEEIKQLNSDLDDAEQENQSYKNVKDTSKDNYAKRFKETIERASDEALNRFSLEFDENADWSNIAELGKIIADKGYFTEWRNPDGKWILDVLGVPDESEVNEILNEWGVNTSEAISEAGFKLTENMSNTQGLENELAGKYNQLMQSALESLETSANFKAMPEAIQSMLRNSVSNMDWGNVLDGDFDNFNMNDFVDDKILKPVVDALNSKEVETAFNKLSALDPSTLNISEYTEAVNEQLAKIKSALKEAGMSDDEFADFVVTLGFKAVDEDGNVIDKPESLMNSIKEAADLKEEDISSLDWDSLTVEQLVKIEAIVDDSSYGDSVKQAYNDVVEETEQAAESVSIEPIPFSSLLEDDSEGSLSKKVEEFRTAMSEIQTALDSLKDGEEIDLSNLLQQFPELAGQTGNLSSALENLKVDKIYDFANKWESATSVLTDKTNIDAASDFFKTMIKDIDLSKADLSTLQSDITNAVWSGITGGDSIKRAQSVMDEFTNEMQNQGDVEILWKLMLDPSNANKTAEELRAKFEGMKLETTAYVKWDEDHEGFDLYNEAKSTENAGDRYLQMMDAFKEANEAYKKGLIGTDDFKSVAAMLSPNGMSDASNWAENYGKALRYFTEDDSGVLNFLSDLESKTDAAGKALATYDDATDDWKLNLVDLNDAADQLGISYETLTAILGRLGDYGFTNDLFSSVEEGQDHLADLYLELADAETKLQDLQEAKLDGDTTVTDAVISEQEARVNQLKSSILETQSLIDQLNSRSVSELEAEQRSRTQAALTALENAEGADTRVQQRMYSDIQKDSEEYSLGIKFEVDENGLLYPVVQSVEEAQKYVDEKPIEITPAEDTTLGKNIRSAMEDETSDVKKMVDSLGKYTKEQLGSINLNDRQYTEGLEDAEKALDGIISSLGLSESEASILIDTLSGLGLLKMDIEPNVDIEGATEAVSRIQNIINTETQKTPGITVKAIVEGNEEIQSLVEEIAAMPPEVQTEIGISTENVGDVNGILNQLVQNPESINVHAEVDSSEVESYTPSDKNAEVKFDKDSSDPDNYKPEDKTAKVNYQLGTIPYFNPSDITRTLTYNITTNGSIPSAGSAAGTLVAHANGTAYNMLNLRAHASGTDVAIKRDEKSVVNELGIKMLSINLFNCWKTLKTIKPQRNDEINISVKVVKTEKINCMRARLNPLLFFNGQSAAKP